LNKWQQVKTSLGSNPLVFFDSGAMITLLMMTMTLTMHKPLKLMMMTTTPVIGMIALRTISLSTPKKISENNTAQHPPSIADIEPNSNVELVNNGDNPALTDDEDF
jgi:hypothetical protein